MDRSQYIQYNIQDYTNTYIKLNTNQKNKKKKCSTIYLGYIPNSS